jgi:hypothetical protein
MTPQTAATGATSALSAADLTRRTIHRRAIEAVIWGMPAVNAELMFQAMAEAKADFNQLTYWSRPITSKNQTLTPNPDTIYLNPYYNTRDGPIVLEIPAAAADASITGSVDDAWQTAIEDVGPAGIDQGKGGKYAILPPGFKDKLPDGFIPMQSPTYTGFAILRSNLRSGSEADIAKAVSYGTEGIKVYPLSQAANPPETKLVDLIDTEFDSTITYDLRFFEMLDRFVQREPWLERDKAMIESLKTIGIEKGKPFAPDDKTKAILEDAIAEAHAYLDTRYQTIFDPPFNEGKHWQLPADPAFAAAVMTNYADPNEYPIEGRGLAYSYAYFSAKHLGAGQYYLMTIVDKDGRPFDGAATYRLNVLANPPVKLYWSATAYDRETHALIRDSQWSSRSSNTPGLQKSEDGSMDVYFAPAAPDGKETNWVPTNASRGFEVLFRLYGPTPDFFEKKWILPDIEKVN